MPITSHPVAPRAVVIGASIAGLLAARVLAERFAEVVLLERDALPCGPGPRKGTPHAVHPHGLLARGLDVIESLFPGFSTALRAQGALQVDVGEAVGFDADARRFARHRAGRQGLLASRLAIEAELRRRVRALPGVHIVCEVDVLGPVHAAGRVGGVRYVPHAEPGGPPQELEAELVVDCSGRGSRCPQWLRAWGYAAPREQRVHVDICYVSAYFERDARSEPPLGCVISTATPALPRPAVLLAQEPDAEGRARWVTAVGGYRGDHAEATPDGLRERARAIGTPEIIALAEHGRRISPVLRYVFAHSQRRRYERLRRFPEGLLVMGDAITSFNPVYGQGMTVAACEALALRAALAQGLPGMHRRFFEAAARVVDIPWQLAVGTDLGLPGVPEHAPAGVRLVNAYIARLFRAAVHDAVVAAAFTKVMHLLQPPASLFAPAVLWRVLRHGAPGRVPRPAPPGLPVPQARSGPAA